MTWVASNEGPREVDRIEALAAVRESRSIAVVRLEEAIEECSSLGGTHLFFVAPGLRAHFGGHGSSVRPEGSLFVAGVTPLPEPVSVKNEVWCIPDRIIHAHVTALIPVSSEEEAAALLA
jgi:hypothetical protein